MLLRRFGQATRATAALGRMRRPCTGRQLLRVHLTGFSLCLSYCASDRQAAASVSGNVRRNGHLLSVGPFIIARRYTYWPERVHSP
jgi:hypothetical protein